jgi:hypothetical protein
MHFTPVDGVTEAEIARIGAEFQKFVRPKVPGPMLELTGRVKDKPGEMVVVALVQDEATYRAMAELPEMNNVYLQYRSVMTSDPTWEDVEMEITHHD